MASLFKLPDEETLAPLFTTFPCREAQIRALATLIYVRTPTLESIQTWD